MLEMKPSARAILAVFLGVSALASVLLGAVQDATGLDPSALRLTTLATAIGALSVSIPWSTRVLLPPTTRRLTIGSVGMALLAATGVGSVLWLLTRVQDSPWPSEPPPADGSLLGALALLLVGALGEELGWRGVVQPVLERRMRVTLAGAVTGVLFGAGHVYVLFAGGPLVFAAFVCSAVALSVLIAHSTAGRALPARVGIAVLIHGAVNAVMQYGFSGGDESLRWAVTSALALGLVAVVVAVAVRLRDRVRRAHRRDSGAEESQNRSDTTRSIRTRGELELHQ